MDYRLKAILPQFTKDYLICAAWTSSESDTENQEFTPNSKREAELDCAMFFGAVVNHYGITKALELLSKKGSDGGYIAGHDFWLTRNGHGTGFWDREEIYGEKEAERLTLISKALGGMDCYHVKGKKSPFCFD